jgi:hypothetical protein
MKNLYLVVQLLCSTVVFAQQGKLTDKEKNALQVLDIYAEIEATSDILVNPTDIFDKDGHFIERRFTVATMRYSILPYLSPNVLVDRVEEKNGVFTVARFYGCTKFAPAFIWENDRITQIKTNSSFILIEYDQSGRVSRFGSAEFNKNGPPYKKDDNSWLRRSTTVEYDENGNWKSYKRLVEKGFGKSADGLKSNFTYLASETRKYFDVETNEWRSETNNYLEKNSASDPDKIIQPLKTVVKVQPDGKMTKTGELVITDSLGRIVEVVKERGQSKIVYMFEYNEQGLKTRVDHTQHNNGAFDTHLVRKYNYYKAYNSTDDPCSLGVTSSQQALDASGQVYQEANDTQWRMKQPDGTWGEWKNQKVSLTGH